jgi:D-glycero-D-manno-heptose 1,7-bisphosphate phosphatase
VILDRDGVINEVRKNYVRNSAEVSFINGSIDAINQLILKNINVVVASNQSCVGRGLVSEKELAHITSFMNSKFIKGLDFFYCMHSPDVNCECRKPKGGLINEIKSKYPGPYLFVGDNVSDFEASQISGVDFALVKTGYGEKFSIQLTQKCRIYNSLFDCVSNDNI